MPLTALKTLIENANNLGRGNLNAKGVTTDGTETTYQIMSKIANVSSEGGGCDVDHDALRKEGYDEGYLAGQESVPVGCQTKTGTFTINADKSQPIITHNCGFIPSVFMVYPIEEYTIGNLMIIGSIIINDEHFNNLTTDKKTQFVWECQASTTNWNNCSLAELTDTTVKLPYRSGNYIWKANFQYGWVAIE
jgi:hypothetical protein